ncbi:hypothetical protein MANES_11G152141v8 [Manihot esculenta]|uniref:Uncharacterized protein n=1 Tax=Manihot esculenta TaxID=3983 RepID=A0ACB7GWB6_MANES|nr:hypothetical protein MANES_11G152141v8 [Manihot esculenta]
MERPLIVVSDSEVRLDFMLNFKCRANVRLRSLSATTPIAFKVQTSAPHKFLVNPPTGLIPPSSSTIFQIILRPQTHLPSSFPRSPSDHFKLKVAFVGPFLLRHAVSSGDVNSVKNIIKRQRSILSELSPREAESLLRVATELADPEGMVNLLLEAGLKIDARAKADDVGFHQMDAKWQSKGWCELHVAIAFDRTDEVLDSLDSFGPLDLRDKEGRTPLHLAAGRGNIKCARVLVESGADKDAKSKDGRTALYRAAANGDHKMVEMLIEMGSDPTIADNHGRSAFDVARDKGHLNITLERGEVVLMAARRGNLEHLESLLKKGANENYKDQYGFTALRAAAIKGHKDIVSMLIHPTIEILNNGGHVSIFLAYPIVS